jgi:hypothetical protein
MSEQKRLALTLKVELTVPRTGIDFKNMISAFQQLSELGVVPLFEAALEAIEQEAGEYLKREDPGRFSWHGYESKKPKSWRTPFGEVHHRYRRMKDKVKGDTFSPLSAALVIPPRKQLTWPLLAGPVALASELSFRKATKEARRFGVGVGPSKSSTWLYFQQFSQGGLDPRKPRGERTLDVVIADGTKLKLQERGKSAGKADLRLALSQRRDGKWLQVAAFSLDKSWSQLKDRLRRDFPGHEVEALLTDGEEHIEALADDGTCIQRCLVHGPRGLTTAMYLDGLSKTERGAISKLFHDAKAWHTDQAALRALPQKDLSYLEDLVEKADEVFRQLLDRLPLTAARARIYLQRFVKSAISYLRALIKGEEPLPAVTTNAAENVFSQINIRLKKIGRRWSLLGALNMLRVLLSKALNSEHWEEYLKLFSATPGAITITCQVLPYYWINS